MFGKQLSRYKLVRRDIFMRTVDTSESVLVAGQGGSFAKNVFVFLSHIVFQENQ